MSEDTKKKLQLGVPGMLIFTVFMLAGIAAGLASMAFRIGLRNLFEDRPLPALTQILVNIPVNAWLIAFALAGAAVSYWFERTERSKGEVPRVMASLTVVAVLVILGLIVVGGSWPFFAWLQSITD